MREIQNFESGFAAAVDLIYEAAANDGAWEPALEKVCDFVGAQGADLCFLEAEVMEFQRIVPVRLDTMAWSRYLRDFTSDIRNTNPRISHFMRRRENDIWAGSELWTPAERGMLPFFAEMVHPAFGAYDDLNTWIRKTDDGRPWISLLLHFGRNDGRPSDEARRRLQILLPHMRRACGAGEQLQQARQDNATLSETLDHVAEAVALVDRAGRVLKANLAAMAIFRAAHGIALAHDGHLIITHADTRDAYAKAVAQCASPILLLSSRSAAPPASIAIPRVDAAPLVLTLQALAKSQAAAVKAVAVLFIADPGAKPVDRGQALRVAYGLSPSEVRLVQALMEGSSLKEFAAGNQLTYETVRSYLRHVLVKTGTRRQSDLVRLIQHLR